MKKILVIAALIILCSLQSMHTQAKSLSGVQKKTADRIVKICTEKYKKYGVLPSVCVGQAIVESSLGRHCRPNNLWGLHCGRASYRSLESGTLAYLRCINNGYYKNAPFEKNYRKQIQAIVRGGYCEPAGNYYYNVVSVIKKYDLTKYDQKMFKQMQEKKKAKKAKKKAKQTKKASSSNPSKAKKAAAGNRGAMPKASETTGTATIGTTSAGTTTAGTTAGSAAVPAGSAASAPQGGQETSSPQEGQASPTPQPEQQSR